MDVNELLIFAVPVMLCFVYSLACSYVGSRSFNFQIFLGAFAISILILCWLGIFPFVFNLIPVLIIAFMLFRM